MKRVESTSIQRKSEVLNRLGLSRSTLHNKIKSGLWCPPISIGPRAVGFIKHEIDELIAAHISGFSDAQIKQLVIKLIEERSQIFEHR